MARSIPARFQRKVWDIRPRVVRVALAAATQATNGQHERIAEIAGHLNEPRETQPRADVTHF